MSKSRAYWKSRACNSPATRCTTILFNRASFLDGIASLGIVGNYYTFNYSQTPEEADERAIKSDWYAVGNDLREALNEELGLLETPFLAELDK